MTEQLKHISKSATQEGFEGYYMMQECLEAIVNTCDEGTYEVIVVDSASTDGVRDYLRSRDDIKLIINDSFPGFAGGCNQGAAAAQKNSDVFLLNNDAVVTPHSVFYLRMGLYENEKTGAVGPLSNSAVAFQKYNCGAQSKEEWMEAATRVNLPLENYARKAHWLQGHALLVRRNVWDELGGLDTGYAYGCGEDNDFGLEVNAAGYYTTVCTNAFVFHYGSVSMKNSSAEENRIKNDNMRRLNEKWGINWVRDAFTRFGILQYILCKPDETVKILDVYSGFGNIWNLFLHDNPRAEVYCIEKNQMIVNVAKNYLNISCCNIDEAEPSYQENFFDYVLLAHDTVQYLVNPAQALKRLQPFLKQDGELIVTSPNPMNIRKIMELAKGNFEPQEDDGILHHFTCDDLTYVLKKAGYMPAHWSFRFNGTYERADDLSKKLVDELGKVEGAKSKSDFFVSDYTIKAHK